MGCSAQRHRHPCVFLSSPPLLTPAAAPSARPAVPLPVALQGHAMTNVADRIRRNETHPCNATGCHRLRRRSAAHCRRHERAARLWGHPSGGAIPKKTLAFYRREAASFIAAHAATPQIAAALSVVGALLRGEGVSNDATRRHLLRLGQEGVTAHEALEIVLAVLIMSHHSPRDLGDDARLTFLLGYAVLSARPMPYRASLLRNGRVHHQTLSPSGTPRREIGTYLRGRLGLFGANVAGAIRAQQQKERETGLALATPFTAAPLAASTIT